MSLKLEVRKRYIDAEGFIVEIFQNDGRGIFPFNGRYVGKLPAGVSRFQNWSYAENGCAASRDQLVEEYFPSPVPQVGEFWKNKHGHKVKVLCVDRIDKRLNPKNYLALAEPHNGVADVKEVDISYFKYKWIDKPEVDWSAMPKWANWVYMIKFTETHIVWKWSAYKPNINVGLDCFTQANDNWGNIPEEFFPKFSGNWQESLTERPK